MQTLTQFAALVLGGDVNGLGVVRSIGRLGVQSAVISTLEPSDHIAHSKYVQTAIAVSKTADDATLLGALAKVSQQLINKQLVIIPTADRYSEFLSRNQEILKEQYLFNCASSELYDTFLDKWKTDEICKTNRLTTPRTICPGSTTELEQQLETFRFPVIIKPRYTFDDDFPGKNAQCDNKSAVLSFFANYDVIAKSIIQEIIPSGDGDIFVLASYSDRHGKVVAMYSGRKLRQFLPDYGATCFGISERQPRLERMTTKFLNSIGYRGFAMIEYARDRTTAQDYFLELNTRTSWTNQLFADSGIDLSQIGFLDITEFSENTQKKSYPQRDGVIWLDFRRDLASMRIKKKRGEISILSWLLSICRARSFAFWDYNDPRPFIAAIRWRLKQIFDKIRL